MSATKEQREAFAVTFEAGKNSNGPAAEYCLRRLLKIALRQFGLRCVSVQKVSGVPKTGA